MDEINSWFRSIINCHESQLGPGHHQGDQSRALHHDTEDNWPLDPQPDSHEDSQGNLASFSRSIPAKTVRSSNTEICDPPETFRNRWLFFFCPQWFLAGSSFFKNQPLVIIRIPNIFQLPTILQPQETPAFQVIDEEKGQTKGLIYLIQVAGAMAFVQHDLCHSLWNIFKRTITRNGLDISLAKLTICCSFQWFSAWHFGWSTRPGVRWWSDW